jgi:hypothetical protein
MAGAAPIPVSAIKDFFDLHGCTGMAAEVYFEVIAILDREWFAVRAKDK